MTPSQMLRKITEPPKVCEPCEKPPLEQFFGASDFAHSAGLSVYACIKQKTCPTCGSKGSTEAFMNADTSVTNFFYCDKSNQHVYEFDDDLGTGDRVSM